MDNTPYYLVDFSLFRNNCLDFMQAFKNEWGDNIIFSYSVKTNHYKELIKYACNQLGWFIETVSPDEYNYCTSLQISPSKMILNGPCKGSVIYSAFSEGSYVNLDNLDEVRMICKNVNFINNVRVGIRVNFDLESLCPGETTAEKGISRFGIDCNSNDFKYALDLLKKKGVKKIGLHMHTSTKTRSLAVFRALANKVINLIDEYNIDISFIDIGGGFFGGQIINGKPTMNEYAKEICDILKQRIVPSAAVLILEPGASVLATCVSYVTKVINVRKISDVNIVTLDGTLLHINPFMAKRQQPFITNITENRSITDIQILCGCTCMENDRLGELKQMGELKVNDQLQFINVGAYTMAFNSHFIINPPNIKVTRP